FIALRLPKLIRSPLARAGRKDLQSITAQAIGAFCGILHAACGGSVNSNAPGRQLRRPFRRGPLQNISFVRDRAAHSESIDADIPTARSPNLRCIRSER